VGWIILIIWLLLGASSYSVMVYHDFTRGGDITVKDVIVGIPATLIGLATFIILVAAFLDEDEYMSKVLFKAKTKAKK